jgi:hypothetical protein
MLRAVFRQYTATGPESSARLGPRTDVVPREGLPEGLPPAQVRVKQATSELLCAFRSIVIACSEASRSHVPRHRDHLFRRRDHVFRAS